MTAQPDLERLRSRKTLPQLIACVRDVLDWPIEQSAVADNRTINVPTRADSPSDVDLASATRDSANSSLAFSATMVNPSLHERVQHRPNRVMQRSCFGRKPERPWPVRLRSRACG
jgi:hypothetical protein